LARGGSIDPAKALLDTAEADAKKEADRFEDPELRELIDQIVQVRAHLRDLVQQQIVGGAGGADPAKMPAPEPATASPATELILRDAHQKAQRVLDQR